MNNPTNRIEFKIVSDSSGAPVNLDEMPLEVSSSLQVFLNSANEIASLQPQIAQVKISLEQNGVCAIEASGDEFTEIENGLISVVEENSNNSDYVKSLREVQKKIKANGLDYDVVIHKNGSQNSLFNHFKTKDVFRVRRGPRIEPSFSLDFITGKLLAVGGKNPNIHIELDNQETITVFCSEFEAQKINSLLYKTITISTWKETKPARKPIYRFCDFYLNNELFLDVLNFYNSNQETEGTHRFNQIHDKIVEVANTDLRSVRKYIRLFLHNSVENGKMKTILITLKAFKNSPELHDILEELASTLRIKSGNQFI